MNTANQPQSASHPSAGRIIIAAASARALAASAYRAGHPVSTIDLFADTDTNAICRRSDRHLLPNQTQNFAWQCQSMDEIFERVERLLGDSAFKGQSGRPVVLLGGGLENCFRNQNTSHTLMGLPSVDAFRKTGRCEHVDEFCRRNSIKFPLTTRMLSADQTNLRWLIKTDFSSGGLGVQPADVNTVLEPDQYFQKYIDGQSISAHYVAGQIEGEEFPALELLGICEPISGSTAQGKGQATENPVPFRYAGSIGPTTPSEVTAALAEIKRVGTLVASHFGIAGIFGVDFILEQDDLWLLEINPRITASAELIEYAARQIQPDFSIVQLHLDALSGKAQRMSALIDILQRANSLEQVFAKRIVYRPHDITQTLRMTQSHIDALESQFGRFAEGGELPVAATAFMTDVPRIETEVAAGQPILTLHVSGKSRCQANQALARAFEVLESIIGERLI